MYIEKMETDKRLTSAIVIAPQKTYELQMSDIQEESNTSGIKSEKKMQQNRKKLLIKDDSSENGSINLKKQSLNIGAPDSISLDEDKIIKVYQVTYESNKNSPHHRSRSKTEPIAFNNQLKKHYNFNSKNWVDEDFIVDEGAGIDDKKKYFLSVNYFDPVKKTYHKSMMIEDRVVLNSPTSIINRSTMINNQLISNDRVNDSMSMLEESLKKLSPTNKYQRKIPKIASMMDQIDKNAKLDTKEVRANQKDAPSQKIQEVRKNLVKFDSKTKYQPSEAGGGNETGGKPKNTININNLHINLESPNQQVNSINKTNTQNSLNVSSTHNKPNTQNSKGLQSFSKFIEPFQHNSHKFRSSEDEKEQEHEEGTERALNKDISPMSRLSDSESNQNKNKNLLINRLKSEKRSIFQKLSGSIKTISKGIKTGFSEAAGFALGGFQSPKQGHKIEIIKKQNEKRQL